MKILGSVFPIGKVIGADRKSLSCHFFKNDAFGLTGSSRARAVADENNNTLVSQFKQTTDGGPASRIVVRADSCDRQFPTSTK